MTAAIIPCEGTTIGYSTTSGGTYTSLGSEVTSITLPSRKQTPVETHGITSTFKTSRPSKLLDADNAGITFFADPNFGAHAALMADSNNGTILWWKITFADSDTTHAFLIFPAYIESFKHSDVGEDANLEWELELHPTADFAFTAGTP